MAANTVTGVAEFARLFLREQRDPVGSYSRLAEIAVASIGAPLAGARVLDLGSGPGYFSRELVRSGAVVMSVETDPSCFDAGLALRGATVGDARQLPVRDAGLDGVFSSNVFEHVADPEAFFSEVQRVLRVGGWAWISWTTWYSPWGGHEMSPFHYLGPKRGARVHHRLRSYPLKNVPGVSLFPRHISSTLRLLERYPGLRLVDAVPRYYPQHRWIMSVPGLREVLAWNCLLYLERVPTDTR